jgi:membrane protein DedA with SNARE-associated domain/membrane-associated phospholipid phosphatase
MPNMKLIDRLLSVPIPFLNHWGYFIILFAATFEAVPLIGFFIPGEMIVTLAGFFAKRGYLNLFVVLAVSAVGAILGDVIGYQIGRKYGHSFITKYGKHFFFKEEYYLSTKRILRAHTGKTLIVGRFNMVTRAFAPFIAGSTKIKFSKFMLYNIIGGVAWAMTFTFLGYVFGTSYDLVSGYFGEVVLAAIIISIVLAYLYKFINKRSKIFTKKHFYALLISIFSLYIFSKMVEDVLKKELVTQLDTVVHAKIGLITSPLLTKIMIVITSSMNLLGIVFLSMVVIGIMVYKKKWYSILLYLFSIGGGALIAYSIKQIMHRTRPENALIHVTGFSFPSGHATVAIIFFSVVLYSFKNEIKGTIGRASYIITGIILTLLIGFSRIYLGVHWFSDIVAGFALGMFWLTLLILLFRPIISFSGKTINELNKKIESYI